MQLESSKQQLSDTWMIKYLSVTRASLEEVIQKYLPDHRPIVMKGLEVESKLVRTNPKFQPLARVAQAVPLIEFEKITQELASKSVLVEDIINIETIRAFICIQHSDNTSFDLLRQSEILHSTPSFAVFSPNVSSELKKRWSRISHNIKESGMKELFDRKERNLLVLAVTDDDRLRYYRCSSRNSLMKNTPTVSNSFSNFHFNRPLRAMALIYFLTVLALCVEVIRGHFRTKKQ